MTGANLNGIIEKQNKSRKLSIMSFTHICYEAGAITVPGHILFDKIILSGSSYRKGNKMWFDDASKEIASY